MKNIEKIKQLLQLHKQTTGKLVRNIDNEYCYCIQGIFLLSLGWKPVTNLDNSTSMFVYDAKNSKSEIQHLTAPANVFFNDLQIPYCVGKYWLILYQEELDLSEHQLEQIKNSNKSLIKWDYLNDIVGLSFEQFLLLFDILEKDLV